MVVRARLAMKVSLRNCCRVRTRTPFHARFIAGVMCRELGRDDAAIARRSMHPTSAESSARSGVPKGIV